MRSSLGPATAQSHTVSMSTGWDSDSRPCLAELCVCGFGGFYSLFSRLVLFNKEVAQVQTQSSPVP